MSISEGNKIKLDLEPDVCMSQRRYRVLRKIEETQPDFVEELMDCRGDLMQNLEERPSVFPWFMSGVVLGIIGALYAK